MSRLFDPLPTRLFRSWDEFTLSQDSAYMFGTSVEERSLHPQEWEEKNGYVEFVRVSSPEEEQVAAAVSSCRLAYGDSDRVCQLRGERELTAAVEAIPGNRVYLDITGLSHDVWAPLLRAVIQTGRLTEVVYSEPESYSYSSAPTEAEIFDLSAAIRDIYPLPGFTSLTEPANEDEVVFVPLLGFEGRRLAYVLEKIQPPTMKNTIPIVGVPGFRMEYPFHTYLGNRNILKIKNLYVRIRYAIANSASDVFYQLSEIAKEHPGCLMKVAPVGTKPHALGAVLFVLHSKRPVELVYDHPIRKAKRTVGKANILVYNVSCILP